MGNGPFSSNDLYNSSGNDKMVASVKVPKDNGGNSNDDDDNTKYGLITLMCKREGYNSGRERLPQTSRNLW